MPASRSLAVQYSRSPETDSAIDRQRGCPIISNPVASELYSAVALAIDFASATSLSMI
ncbi:MULTISPECIES: hypothetical protein [unclassified Microcoleus]|uniref:hypothetical protein n=1 Tax=unclassified Microcoleus TaxID=2642155 RepID=UPI002FD711AF